ncbi:MAG TPA: DUF6311 domain-containing protein, partial [Puia sp.]|nr:DUF6311 domain-containing protein [Puia sp.]
MKNKVFWIASLIAVVIIYHVTYGLATLIPTNVRWLMKAMDDWGTHYLGWFFYRNEPWHFPLGHVSGYFYPLGTNVGFTDSIPLMAVFFKLFAPILPSDFQYLGFWLFSCHLLAAYFTIRFFQLFKVRPLYIFLAVLFVAANPVLVYRGMHPALCTQWLLIASLWVYFSDPSIVNPKKLLSRQFILLMIAATVNPYICFMVFGLTLTIAVKLCWADKLISKKRFILFIAGSIFFALLSWYLLGLVEFGNKEDLRVQGAYGLYSLNLNSLYNASGFSTFLPQYKWVSWHQYEGFMYLGMGIFLLLLFLIGYGLYRLTGQQNRMKWIPLKFSNTNLVPLYVLLILLTLFSITNIISLNDKVLLKIPLPDFLIHLGDIFRASARFFWTPYYLILFFALIAVTKIRIRSWATASVIIAALLIQLYDTKLLLTFRNLSYGSYETPLDNKSWMELMDQFDDIAFYPPFESHQLTHMDYQYFCFLAAKLHKPINIGYVARSDGRAMKIYSDSLSAALEDGKLSPRTLYISTIPYLNHFALLLQSGSIQLNTLDGYYWLLPESRNNGRLASLSTALNLKNKETLDSLLKIVSRKTLFTETQKITTQPGKPIQYFLQRVNTREKYIAMEGWGFIDSTHNNKGDSIFVTLNSAYRSFIAPAQIQARPDVSNHFNKGYLDDAGFKALAYFDNVPKGKYQAGIAIRNTQGHWAYQTDEHMVKAGIPEYATPEKTGQLPPAGKIVYGLDPPLPVSSDLIELGGWAAMEGQGAEGYQISIVLKNEKNIYVCATDPVLRPDVTAHFNNKYTLDHSGFRVQVLKNTLDNGKYQVG